MQAAARRRRLQRREQRQADLLVACPSRRLQQRLQLHRPGRLRARRPARAAARASAAPATARRRPGRARRPAGPCRRTCAGRSNSAASSSAEPPGTAASGGEPDVGGQLLVVGRARSSAAISFGVAASAAAGRGRRRRPRGSARRPSPSSVASAPSSHVAGSLLEAGAGHRPQHEPLLAGAASVRRAGRRAAPGSAALGANRASCADQLVALAGRQLLDAASRSRKCPASVVAPLGVPAGDPPGRLLQRGVGRGQLRQRRPPRRACRPPSGPARSARPGGPRAMSLSAPSPSPRGRRSRSGRRSASAPATRSVGSPSAASSAGTAVASPIRPSASAAPRRLCGDLPSSSFEQRRRSPSRSRHRLTECSAAWRTLSSASRQRQPDGGAGVGVVDPRRRPDGVAPRLGATAPARIARVDARPSAPLAASASIARRRTAGRGSSEQLRQLLGGRPSPSRASGRAGRRPSARPSGGRGRCAPEHVRLVELRRRAAQLVPAAGVDHEQAAVGVLDHVGRVEVEVVARRGSPRRGVVNVAPVGVSTCRVTLCRLNRRRRGCRGTRRRTRPTRSASARTGRRGPRCVSTGISVGAGPRVVVDRRRGPCRRRRRRPRGSGRRAGRRRGAGRTSS